MGHETGAEHQLMLDMCVKMMKREEMIGEIQMVIDQHQEGTRGNRERAKMKIIGWILRLFPTCGRVS